VTVRREGATEIDIDVDVQRSTVLVLRDAYDSGWSALVNGSQAPLLRADGRQRAVPVTAGRSRVLLRYSPPGLAGGLLVSALSAAALLALFLRPRGFLGPAATDGERA